MTEPSHFVWIDPFEEIDKVYAVGLRDGASAQRAKSSKQHPMEGRREVVIADWLRSRGYKVSLP